MQYEYSKAIFTGQTLEVYRYEKAPQVATGPRRRKAKPDNGGPCPAPKRRYDTVKRLRRNFTRLVQSQLSAKGAPAFLTLTFSANATLDDGLEVFRQFNKRAKKVFGDSVSYIAVPEFQKRGAVHFHCLVWGLEDKYILHEAPYEYWKRAKKRIRARFFAWCSEKGYDPKDARGVRLIQAVWAHGYADCVPADDSPKLASYLGKYMQKAMLDERLNSRRAYYCSRGVVRPMLYKTSLVANYPEIVLGVELELLTEKTYSTQWLGEGNYQVFTVKTNGKESTDCDVSS